jgi:hypothetical protein
MTTRQRDSRPGASGQRQCSPAIVASPASNPSDLGRQQRRAIRTCLQAIARDLIPEYELEDWLAQRELETRGEIDVTQRR